METSNAFTTILFIVVAFGTGTVGGLFWDKLKDLQSLKGITSETTQARAVSPAAGHGSGTPVLLGGFNASRCLRNKGHLGVAVTSHPVILSLSDLTRSSPFTCTVRLVASRDHVLFVAHSGHAPSSRSTCLNRWKIDFLVAEDCFVEKKMYISRTNTLEIVIVAGQPPVTTYATVRAVGKVLEHGNITDTMGMDSWVKLSVPSNHVTLVSFMYIFASKFRNNRCPDAVTKTTTFLIQLYKEGQSAKDIAWNVCWNSNVPLPEVHDARVLFFRFLTGRPKVYFGATFKLLYSFHKKSHQPCRADSGLWNCSVVTWPTFQRHFLCNLVKECEGEEDEARCPYTGHCGQGHLTIGDRCYTYHFANGSRSWRESNLVCQQKGGYLVSLNTPEEWRAVMDVLTMRRSPTRAFVGLYDTPSVLPAMYKHMHVWVDKTVAYFFKSRLLTTRCTLFEGPNDVLSQTVVCDCKKMYVDFLCEWEDRPSLNRGAENSAGAKRNKKSKWIVIRLPVLRNYSFPVPTVSCPTGHATHAFQACDEQSACWFHRRRDYDESEARGMWGIPSVASCPAPMTSLPALFACASGLQRVPYSVVCDHRQQCVDGSDESFCVFPPCSGTAALRCATSSQCVAVKDSCNSQKDCQDGSDEAHCFFYNAKAVSTPTPPAIVHFTPVSSLDKYSHYPEIHPLVLPSSQANADSSPCPETHFQCPNDGYCLPVFVRCNDVNDCPGHEDETGCDGATCPGFYHCRSSEVCLHPSHVCDDVYQCPQHDDELFCSLACPEECSCYGLHFTCPQPFRARRYPEMKYLDASGSGLTLSTLRGNVFLIHVSLSRCGLENLHYASFPNLRTLDLSHNDLRTISADHLRGVLNLQYVSLSGNPLTSLFSPDTENVSFPALRLLDVSDVKMHALDVRSFSLFPDLRTLNLSHCGVSVIAGEGFRVTTKLQVLDIRGCPMTEFPRDLLSGLDHLQSVEADNFKLCCPVILPAGFNLENCRAPFDEVSSCESLLRSDVYRVFLSVFSSLASLGNFSCFVLRSFVLKSSASGFGVFVHHLSISDFLMGVYMAIIGVADRLYKGSYLWEVVSWRHSAACRVAGFLSLMSNEVSALVICLITLDRFLVLRFPFSRLRFSARSAHLTCATVWVIVMAVSAFPLTPMTSHWSFYSQTGICIPLPVTRSSFAGHQYAFGLLIVFNFILFLLIAAGQAAIYLSIRANRMTTADSTKKSTDLRIARRLISVAVSDFLCWFPIGLLGLLASRGVPIPGEANVGIAILVLPLNSALNPFLYTINVVLERRMKVRDERLFKQLIEYSSQEK